MKKSCSFIGIKRTAKLTIEPTKYDIYKYSVFFSSHICEISFRRRLTVQIIIRSNYSMGSHMLQRKTINYGRRTKCARIMQIKLNSFWPLLPLTPSPFRNNNRVNYCPLNADVLRKIVLVIAYGKLHP